RIPRRESSTVGDIYFAVAPRAFGQRAEIHVGGTLDGPVIDQQRGVELQSGPVAQNQLAAFAFGLADERAAARAQDHVVADVIDDAFRADGQHPAAFKSFHS